MSLITLYRYMPLEAAIVSLDTRLFQLGAIDKLNDPFDSLPLIKTAIPVGDEARNDLAQQYRRSLSDHLGILSFSAKRDEPVLWSHYSDCHRGVAFVLEFEASKVNEVAYQENRGELSDEIVKESLHGGAPLFVRVKSPTWRYEEEYRFFCELKTAHAKNGRYYVPMNKFSVKGIILGLKCNVSPVYFKNVLKSGGFNEAKVWTVSIHPQKFALEIYEA